MTSIMKHPLQHLVCIAFAVLPIAAPASDSGFESALRENRLKWIAGAPVAHAAADSDSVAFKDPTIVFAKGRWHVYATDVGSRNHRMTYFSFADWPSAATAKAVTVKAADGKVIANSTAPHLFFFRPHQKWYLFYGCYDRNRPPGGPAFSVLEDVDQPEQLTAPELLFKELPPSLPPTRLKWLDFWVIAAGDQVHLFFTTDEGHLLRCRTTVSRFPRGWSDVEVVLREGKHELFEGSCTYRMGEHGDFLTIIEAIDTKNQGSRYFRAFTAPSLDGPWASLGHTGRNPFAGLANVTFDNGIAPWTQHISHGEMIRDTADERMLLDLRQPRFLFQGCARDDYRPAGQHDYHHMVWRLGLLRLAE
jgi:endo-1,4-beta-xylanase